MKVFFDVDGVLIDGWHSKLSLRKPWDINIQADLGVNRDLFQAMFFSPRDGRLPVMHECVMGKRDLREALVEILPAVDYNGHVDDFMQYWFQKDANINEAVLGLVADIRNADISTYVATGQEHYRAAYLWNTLGLCNSFEHLFYSAALGYLKKDIRFFEAINEALQINGEERPIFFDDQPEIVEIAKSVGWDSHAFDSVQDIQNHPRLRHIWS
jgi:putative hydrolase of the HAD superfamily